MTLAEHLHAETHRWLALIGEFDRLEGWKLYGFGSCAAWLAYSTRLDKATAREKVRVARALAGLPETSAAMARGELSFSQVRALTRVADEENELELLGHARSTSAAGLERLVRSWKRLDREDEAALEARRHATRSLSVFPDDQGMYVVRGRLDPEVGALLMRAIEAGSDALYRGSVPDTSPEQRRADALALLVERALVAGLGDDAHVATATEDGQAPTHGPGVSAETSINRGDTPERLDTFAATDHRHPTIDQGLSAPDHRHSTAGHRHSTADHSSSVSDPGHRCAGSRRTDRYLVVLHVDEPTLREAGEIGRSELEDGTRVSAETSRRISCDASVVRVRHGDSGAPRVEGKTRTVPSRLRRMLDVRDRGCRFPGCGSRFTEAHHIRHWADGGETVAENLILLCRAHHRLLHEGGFRLKTEAGRPIFCSPRGIPIPDVPPQMTLNGRPIRESTKDLDTGGAAAERASHPSTAPRWEEDVPLAAYLRTLEDINR